jgi:hypothetical protein
MESIEPKRISPKEAFLYLLMIGTLYASVVSFLTLLFQYVNIYVPDILDYYSTESALGNLRWAVAMLSVLFPVFVWVSWLLYRESVADMAKLSGRFRKWLLYLTIFISGIVIMSDLVSLIYNFLDGDLTTRFILKSLSVLVVAAAVFGYYLWEIRRKEALAPKKMTYFIYAVVALVTVGIVVGFFVAGSPFAKRAERLDERRISDLQIIQGNIVNFYQRKGVLPENLNALRDDISGFVTPADPESSPYEYSITDKLSFRLCATFSKKGDSAYQDRGMMARPTIYGAPYGGMENWDHDMGHQCFDRTIDPQIYPKDQGVGPVKSGHI